MTRVRTTTDWRRVLSRLGTARLVVNMPHLEVLTPVGGQFQMGTTGERLSLEGAAERLEGANARPRGIKRC